MNAVKHNTELSTELLSFLEQIGYTHILSVGAAQTEFGTDGDTDDYHLIPLKPDDPRLSYQETDYIVSAINSSDVKEMAEGVEFIRFMIEVPLSEFELFLNRK